MSKKVLSLLGKNESDAWSKKKYYTIYLYISASLWADFKNRGTWSYIFEPIRERSNRSITHAPPPNGGYGFASSEI